MNTLKIVILSSALIFSGAAFARGGMGGGHRRWNVDFGSGASDGPSVHTCTGDRAACDARDGNIPPQLWRVWLWRVRHPWRLWL
jgi:hypothetical protein